MLSNRSMPRGSRGAAGPRSCVHPCFLAICSAPAFQGDPAMSSHPPNYAYWHQSGGEWASEYDRRRTRHPFSPHRRDDGRRPVAHHAPCRVLEFGCGPGRHLLNLSRIEGSTCAASIRARRWWRPASAGPHPSGGPRTSRSDRQRGRCRTRMAISISSSPRRRCSTPPRGPERPPRRAAPRLPRHVLHLELAVLDRVLGVAQRLLGARFRDGVPGLGHTCEVLPPGFTRQTPYRTAVRPESVKWTWRPAMLALYRRMEEQLEEGFQRAGAAGYASSEAGARAGADFLEAPATTASTSP